MFLWLHIGGWIWLALMVTLGLTRRAIKSANRYLILSRLGYLLLIITGVYLAAHTFATNWWLTLLKAGLGLATIGLTEVAFARQQESHLTGCLRVLLVAGFILTAGCGIGLHLIVSGHWF